MIDLACYDCLTCFGEDELDDCKCPKCGSSHYDDSGYYIEQIDNLSKTILQHHAQLEMIERILKDGDLFYENRVEYVLELLEQLK